MNIGRLRALIAGMPDDMPVVVAKDGEGNDFSPLATTEEAFYEAQTTWYGDYIHPSDASDYPDAVKALILWPVN